MQRVATAPENALATAPVLPSTTRIVQHSPAAPVLPSTTHVVQHSPNVSTPVGPPSDIPAHVVQQSSDVLPQVAPAKAIEPQVTPAEPSSPAVGGEVDMLKSKVVMCITRAPSQIGEPNTIKSNFIDSTSDPR